MKTRPLIAVSGRLDNVEGYDEIRVALDIRMFDFLELCGVDSFLIPYQNNIDRFLAMADGFLLSGGGDLSCRIPTELTRKRDALESRIAEYARNYQKPILGICRGMQFINCYYGGGIGDIDNHVACRHEVHIGDNVRQTNSYHNQEVNTLGSGFQVWAESRDGVIEGIFAKGILCIMWHPEREATFSQDDIQIVRDILCGPSF